MPCPTCDYTMQWTAEVTFWCPRCGTLKDGRAREIAEPVLRTQVPTNRDELAHHARRLAEHVAGEPHVTTVEIMDVARRVLELTEERDGEA